MKKSRDLSGPDWYERFKADPEWTARKEQWEREAESRARRFREEEAPLLKDLLGVGVEVNSVWDLVNTKERYPEAIPALLKHLKNIEYSREIREGIARALTVREARGSQPELIAAFRRDPDTAVNGAKWAIGNALEALWDERYVEEVAELARDRSHGPARNILVFALGRSKSEIARETIESLRSDPDEDVAIMVDRSLERWRRRQARLKSRGTGKKSKGNS